MKVAHLSIGLLALLSPLTAAWSKEDREIFRIRDEITAHETDPASTFYDILGVRRSASHDEITKAYRQKSRSLHPDKVKQQTLKAGKEKGAKKPSTAQVNAAVKKASEAQTRLSLIANILRGPERDRYDYFLANGFPLWKGTDYYYNRYRPGLGTAVTGVLLLCGGAVHYLVLYMSWRRQRDFLERYIRHARETAWGAGGLGVPGVDTPPTPTPAPADDDEDTAQQPMNRRQRRMQTKETKRDNGASGKKGRKAAKSAAASSSRDASAAATTRRKRIVAENGKILVVDSLGDVYLEEQDEEGNTNEFLLDTEELHMPTMLDTAVVRVPVWAFRSTVGRLLPASSTEEEEGQQQQQQEEAADEDATEGEAALRTPSSDSAGDDFEFLDKSTDSLNKAKASGAQQQQQQGGKSNKRKGKKR